MELNTTVRPGELGAALRADHHSLETTFRRVLGKLRGGDTEFVREAWLAMEADLNAHLKAEEELILPHFERVNPKDAEHIRRDHAQIRATLDRLGIELDLHTLREETADQFISSLETHARHEEEALYHWAEEHLADEARRSVIERLRAFVLGDESTHEPDGRKD